MKGLRLAVTVSITIARLVLLAGLITGSVSIPIPVLVLRFHIPIAITITILGLPGFLNGRPQGLALVADIAARMPVSLTPAAHATPPCSRDIRAPAPAIATSTTASSIRTPAPTVTPMASVAATACAATATAGTAPGTSAVSSAATISSTTAIAAATTTVAAHGECHTRIAGWEWNVQIRKEWDNQEPQDHHNKTAQ